jgi:MOSC domain-containing protein YiiM
LPSRELPIGIFGENFTVEGMLEESVHLGDQFSVGSAGVVVTQPRLPCYKLGTRFEDENMVKRFLASRRTGFYLAVTNEGDVGAGDEMRVISRDSSGVPVSEITRLYAEKRYSDADVAWVRRALHVAELPEVGRSTSDSGWSGCRLLAESRSATVIGKPVACCSVSRKDMGSRRQG